jgi:hypothetical protein
MARPPSIDRLIANKLRTLLSVNYEPAERETELAVLKTAIAWQRATKAAKDNSEYGSFFRQGDDEGGDDNGS